MIPAIVFVGMALLAYLVGALNWSIIFARVFYHQDIRTVGSKNPGFTNFKRVYGNKLAWFVFFLDMSKGAVVGLAAYFLFDQAVIGIDGLRQIGIAYSGLFAMIGNAYPVYYKFQGGKGFSVAAGIIWFIDWRAALIAMGVMMILLFTVRWMSLSVMVAGLTCPISVWLFGWLLGEWHHELAWIAPIIVFLAVAFMCFRHKENIKRIFQGNEKKFYLKKKKEAE